MKTMQKVTVHIPYDGKTCAFQIPRDQFGEVVVPNRLPAVNEVAALTEQTLSRPIGSLPLEAIAKPGMTVAVIIDDISRPTPTAEMLPPVLNRIRMAGVAKKDIRIVIALGSHRPLTPEEIELKTGSEIAGDYCIVNTACQDSQEMRFIGDSSNGIPAEVNRWVVGADLRIGIGAIGPHMDTGFSGGGKIILPGVCSCRSVNAFHARSAEIPGNYLGEPEAPARLRMESFVEERIPLDFIVNAILHPDGGLYQCVAGHFIRAQRKGAEYARQLYGVKVKKRYPLVIANSYPFEIDFWQCTKAFWCGERMAADGGMVVMVSPCLEGTTTHPLWADYLGWDTEDLKKHLERDEAEDPSACAFAVMFGQMRKRVRFAVISPHLSEARVREMGLFHFDSIEQAIAASVATEMRDAVAVMTHGGLTVPMVTT
jgi:nickel-dependent lactate racemase